MPSKAARAALTAFGFTDLEAEVYVFLLRESPATAYRVAQAIGKPPANTYKAVESLQAKGAVVVDDGGSRQCRAVPAGELLARLEAGPRSSSRTRSPFPTGSNSETCSRTPCRAAGPSTWPTGTRWCGWTTRSRT